MDDYTSIILRALRKYYCLSQVQLAELVGIGQGTLSKIERGKLELSAIQWTGICQKYSLNPFAIITGKINDIGPSHIEPAKTNIIGTFKVDRKYFKKVDCPVRKTIPFLDYLERRLGDGYKVGFYKEYNVDPDYFVIQKLPINTLFFQEVYAYLKSKNLISIENIDDLVLNEPEWSNILKEVVNESLVSFSERPDLQQYVDIISQVIGGDCEFHPMGNDSVIEVRDGDHLKDLELIDEFNKFRQSYYLSLFKLLAKFWNADFSFAMKSNDFGWTLVKV